MQSLQVLTGKMELSTYFSLIVFSSLFCLGLRTITDVGMIAYPVRKFFFDRFPYLGKPIILCPACMSSVWGTAVFWFFCVAHALPINSYTAGYWIGVIVSSSFINAVSWTHYEKMLVEMD